MLQFMKYRLWVDDEIVWTFDALDDISAAAIGVGLFTHSKTPSGNNAEVHNVDSGLVIWRASLTAKYQR